MAHAIVLELLCWMCWYVCVCTFGCGWCYEVCQRIRRLCGGFAFAFTDPLPPQSLSISLSLTLCSVLSDNSIARIDADAFLGLTKLKRLSLHNCGLTAVPAEALQRIRGLHTLYVLMVAEARLALAKCAF